MRRYLTIVPLLMLSIAGCSDEPTGPGMVLRDASVTTDEGGFDAATGQPDADADAGASQDAAMACTRRRESFDILSAAHVANPTYDDPPPTGGPHKPCWLDYGVYDAPADPGNWVHNLEHGAVVLLHNCGDDGCVDAVDAMASFVGSHERTILTPYPDLPTRFGIVAWGERLLLDCFDLEAMSDFYDAHFNRARENVASGAPSGC